MKQIVLHIIFFLLVCSNPLIGGNILYDRLENNAYVVEFTASSPEKMEINNFFIKELAKYNFSGLYNTSFVYHYSIHNNITRTSLNTFTVTTELIGEKCTGDIYYKEFDISDILMPDKVDYKVIIVDQGNYIEQRIFNDVGLNEDNKFFSEFTFESFDDNKEFILKLDEIDFYSDRIEKETFYQRLNLIDDYYASLSLLDYAVAESEQLTFSPNHLVEDVFALNELERIYAYICNSDFHDVLKNSPSHLSTYNSKIEEFQILLERANSNFLAQEKNIEFLKLKQSVEKHARLYVENIASYYLLSQEVTHSFSSYYYNLATADYNSIMLEKYYSRLKKILLKTGKCNEVNVVLNQLKSEISIVYLDKASEFVEDQQYYLAKGMLNNWNDFQNSMLKGDLSVEYFVLLSNANYGIYDSYLHLIDRAIEVGNYKLADSYINKANSFQQENKSSIISNQFLSQISERLSKLYIAKGDNLLDNESYREALYCYNQAQMLCEKIGTFNFDYEIKHGLSNSRNGLYNNLIISAGDNLEIGSFIQASDQIYEAMGLLETYSTQIIPSPEADEVRSVINYYVYQNLIYEGQQYLDEGNYYLAHENFLKAKTLEKDSKFEVNESLSALFVSTATPYLVDQCKLGEVKVSKNELDNARKIYDNTFNQQMEYGLNFAQPLQASLTMLNNSIFNKYCENSNSRFNDVIFRFENNVNTGDFITAIEVLNETDNIYSEYYYCDFDKEFISDLSEKYKPAAEYQVLAKEAQEALASEDHDKFINIHHEMEELSANNEIIRQHIEPLPLHYLFSVKKNLAHLETTINFYKEEDEFEIAINLLKVLEGHNYSNKETRAIQQSLATQIAYMDRYNQKGADPKLIVNQYTEGNTWYKPFKKAYLKNW